MTDAEEGVGRKRSIVVATILAALLSAAIASGIGYALGDEITTPEMYAQHGASGDGFVEFWVAFAISVGAALIVWLGFFILIFRKRSKLWKSLFALVAVVFVTVVVAMPVRIGTMLMHQEADREAIEAVREREREERREIRARLAPDLEALGDLNRASVTRVEEIVDDRARLQDALGKMHAYHAAINAHLEATRAELQAMDVYSELKAEAVSYYDGVLQPQSNVQRHLTVTENILEQQVGLATYILDHRSSWMIMSGRVTFIDPPAFEEAQDRIQALDALEGERDRLEGAMGRDGEKPLFGEEVATQP